jgi:hypothetical protein
MGIVLAFIGNGATDGGGGGGDGGSGDGSGIDYSGPLGLAAALVFVLFMVLIVGWIFLGLAWAPLNAWGLGKRKKWIPLSMLAYGGMCVLSCIGLPYGAYLLWLFSRPYVREAFTEV